MNELEKYYQNFWYVYDGEPELQGPSPFGFQGGNPLNSASFNIGELDWALSSLFPLSKIR